MSRYTYESDILGVIYLVTNKINGKQYVGKTVRSLKERKKQHLNDAKSGKDDFHFHRAIRKYGEGAFEWEIIDECEDEKELNTLEIFYIQKYNTFKGEGYNGTPGGEGYCGENHPFYGKHHTEESKRKISESLSGENHPFYGKKRPEMSGKNNPMYGKRGEETSFYGKHHTEETKQKIREANSGKNHPMYGKRGEDNPNHGKRRTEEWKKEHSERMSGKNNPMYGKRGRNNPNYGKKSSKEKRKKVSKAHRAKGLFGFTGACYAMKKGNPWTKVWQSYIKWKGRGNFLGCFQDPLSCQIVYDLVWKEIYK